ncbi:MAG: hypothetical protein AB1352_02240 [Patescibacteria group bacterium]
MYTLSYKVAGWTVSVFSVLAYALCFLWAFTLAGGQRDLHIEQLRMAYLKFAGLDVASFLSGLVQTFVWGWIAAVVFVWLWNRFYRKFERPVQG